MKAATKNGNLNGQSWRHAIENLVDRVFAEPGRQFLFFIDSLKALFQKPYRWKEILKHIEFIGNRSVFIICLTGMFSGMVFSFQAWIGFKLVNAENLVGATTALGVARELGPVLTGLILAARAGGAMAARLGTMRVTEQIDALEVMGIGPVQYLVGPRIFASLISAPMMTAVFDFMAMLGTWVFCVHMVYLDEAILFDKVEFWIDPSDINEGLIKGALFGLIFSTLCCYRGFHAEGGAKGVGDATNKGVVASMVSIIVVDFFASKFIRFIVELGL